MEEEYERAKQKRKEKIMREAVKRGEKVKGNIVEQKNRRNLNGSVKKQNVLQLTFLTDEASEGKNSLFAKKKAAIHVHFGFIYTVYGKFYTSTEGVVAPESV